MKGVTVADKTLTRRALLYGAAASAGLRAARQIRVGLQLFSIRKLCEKDLPGTLEEVRRIGFEGVEFAGFHRRPAAEIRALLENNGLLCCGSHTPLNQLSGEKFDKTVQFGQEIGAPYLIVPGLPASYHSPEGWRAAAKALGDLDGRLSPLGLRVGYHNHSIEFKPAGGSTPWDVLFGETPAGVVMQVDLGNARNGGADPVALIERYPGRAKTIHVKDHLPGRSDVQIGSSDFDWARLQRACRSAGGTEWYIIEHASETMDEIAESLRRFRSVLVD